MEEKVKTEKWRRSGAALEIAIWGVEVAFTLPTWKDRMKWSALLLFQRVCVLSSRYARNELRPRYRRRLRRGRGSEKGLD